MVDPNPPDFEAAPNPYCTLKRVLERTVPLGVAGREQEVRQCHPVILNRLDYMIRQVL